jgi:FtsP/CotA-like multicopper oxidase with cupredoxin domain
MVPLWSYWIIQKDTAQGTPPIPHPIHLHGHDFYLLGASAANAGQFTTADIAGLNFENPTRRDVAMLPPGGWLVIAFQTNNPGAWLMHCHIVRISEDSEGSFH